MQNDSETKEKDKIIESEASYARLQSRINFSEVEVDPEVSVAN